MANGPDYTSEYVEGFDALFDNEKEGSPIIYEEDNDSITVDDPFEVAASSTGNTSEEIDFDALSIDADPEELAELNKSFLLQKGLYRWIDTPKVRVNFSATDRQPTDVMQKLYKITGEAKANTGRMFINVSGVAYLSSDPTRKGFLTFGFSPDTRYFKGTENRDGFSRTFNELVKLYQKKHEAIPKRIPGDIVDMIKARVYEMYVTVSKNGDRNNISNFQVV